MVAEQHLLRKMNVRAQLLLTVSVEDCAAHMIDARPLSLTKVVARHPLLRDVYPKVIPRIRAT